MTVLDILLTYYPAFFQGLWVSMQLCLIIWLSGLVGGIALGALGAYRAATWGRLTHYVAFAFSAIPTLVILFWLHYPAQALVGVVINPFYTAAFAFSLVNVFAVGELVRQAILDFPKQYMIAGRVCGLNTHDILRYIQLPLLFRQLLPGLMTQQVVMLHATLFASLISVEEIFRVAQRINSSIYRPVEIYTALACFFLLVCLPINLLAVHLKNTYTRDMSER
ncbi:MAG: ABC transporter permease subunit [Rhodospirillaceae bacterium]|nr:ABC transporter permease subunit [Rhodospirillaceae bacterium]